MPAAERSRRLVAAGMTAVLLAACPVRGQELEPRAYSPAPTGTTFLAIAATRSTGGVFTDPSSVLTDVEADIGILGLGVGYTFGLLGKSALVLGLVPVAWGEARGAVGEDRLETSRRGLADPRVKLSAILAGSRAMTPAEFARAPRRPIVGTSLTVVLPVGQYSPAKLVNLGSNRWSLKPEVGISVPVGRWTIESYAGLWVFTDNGAFYPGRSLRAQDRIVTIQGHVSYTFGPRGWLAVDATWYGGGQIRVDSVEGGAPYRNTRFGVTWAVPIGDRQSLKASYSRGAAARVGADFTTFSGAWQIVIF